MHFASDMIAKRRSVYTILEELRPQCAVEYVNRMQLARRNPFVLIKALLKIFCMFSSVRHTSLLVLRIIGVGPRRDSDLTKTED